MNTPEVDRILAQASVLAGVRHSAFDDEDETRRKLNAHGLDDAEIARQLATLKANSASSTGVLTSYSLLHSLQHLDNIGDRTLTPLPCSAEATVTLFRCAEVCIHNIGVLSARMMENIQAGRLSLAVSNAHWRAGFQEVLYRLSALVVEVSDDPAPGVFLDIRDSRIYTAYLKQNDELQQLLRAGWAESSSSIFEKDLDDPQRYVFFNEFVNASDERVWISRMSKVRLSGEARVPGEDAAAAYERIVCSDEIEGMLVALETEADTDLLPFRAIHQVSEIIASFINRHLCDVIPQLLSSGSDNIDRGLRVLVVSNRLLAVVDDVIKLMMRSLTPRAYRQVRPNLGMVRGTSSVVLRKTLFNTTYPLLVRAFKLRISGFSAAIADDDDVLQARAVALMESADRDDRQLAAMMQQLIVLHQHVRTWRDNHQQLPKTHLGVSPFQNQPTVSLSGSGSAVDIAHGLRKAHTYDPIIPLYKAAMGTAPPDVHELLNPGGFEEHMAHATARAVLDVYADVQERFYERTRGKGVQ